jgi:hypothetical protein
MGHGIWDKGYECAKEMVFLSCFVGKIMSLVPNGVNQRLHCTKGLFIKKNGDFSKNAFFLAPFHKNNLYFTILY